MMMDQKLGDYTKYKLNQLLNLLQVNHQNLLQKQKIIVQEMKMLPKVITHY